MGARSFACASAERSPTPTLASCSAPSPACWRAHGSGSGPSVRVRRRVSGGFKRASSSRASWATTSNRPAAAASARVVRTTSLVIAVRGAAKEPSSIGRTDSPKDGSVRCASNGSSAPLRGCSRCFQILGGYPVTNENYPDRHAWLVFGASFPGITASRRRPHIRDAGRLVQFKGGMACMPLRKLPSGH